MMVSRKLSLQQKEVEMIKADIYREIDDTLKPLGKDFSWLNYAHCIDGKYKILNAKKNQYQILNQILKRLVKKYPTLGEGKVAQLLSEIVNTPNFE